jgi:hypothetical protein
LPTADHVKRTEKAGLTREGKALCWHLDERRLFVPKEFVLSLNENFVRFTPNGEIAVIDAIKMLAEPGSAEEIWKALKDENPEILSHCKRFHFPKSNSVMVADSQGWEQIESLLFDYILDRSLS